MAETQIQDEELLLETPVSRKSKLPTWFKPVLLIIGICVMIFVYTRYAKPPLPEMNVKNIDKPAPSEASRLKIQNSPSYMEKLSEYSTRKTQAALQAGTSFVPPVSDVVKGTAHTPTLGLQKIPPKEEAQSEPERAPNVQKVPKPTPKSVAQEVSPTIQPRHDQARAQLLANALTSLLHNQHVTPQALLVFNQPRSLPKLAQPQLKAPAKHTLDLKAGDLLYALNRISLNSDAPGPAMVEVVHGKYLGAKLLGNFVRQENTLTLRFQQLILATGKSYTLEAYAVDPKTARTAIASSVDHHYLERFGGLIAASFLEGFGEAVKNTGTSTYATAYGSASFQPNYDLNAQLWQAAGKVGQRTANILSQNFTRQPTVMLEANSDIGVLIIKSPEAVAGS